MNSLEVQNKIAEAIREHRINFNFTQLELSQRSGVALATLRKFERTGQISLESFIKIAIILGLTEKLVKALEPSTPPTTIDQLLAADKTVKRKRVRK